MLMNHIQAEDTMIQVASGSLQRPSLHCGKHAKRFKVDVRPPLNLQRPVWGDQLKKTDSIISSEKDKLNSQKYDSQLKSKIVNVLVPCDKQLLSKCSESMESV